MSDRSSQTLTTADGSPKLDVDEARVKRIFVLVRTLWQPLTKTRTPEPDLSTSGIIGTIGFIGWARAGTLPSHTAANHLRLMPSAQAAKHTSFLPVVDVTMGQPTFSP